MSKPNRKGRNRAPPFVMLLHSMTASAAWVDLSGNAVKLLVHMAKLYNGSNNGEIGLSERGAAAAIGVARATARAAIDDLERHGFIALTGAAAFSNKMRLAPTWRLTFQPCGAAGPTLEYRDWKP